ncbi:MAG: hypothetical protein ACERKO_02625 [Acetanaerobacterium sp.]
MRRVLLIFAAAVVCLMGCVNTPQSGATESVVSKSDDIDYGSSLPRLSEDDGILASIVKNLTDPDIDIKLSPGIDDVHYVDITDELRLEIARVFAENKVEKNVMLVSDFDFICEKDPISFQLTKTDEDWIYCDITLLEPEDPAFPNKVYVSAYGQNFEKESYLYDKEVYDLLAELIANNTHERKAQLNGEQLFLRPLQDEDYINAGEYGDFLECGNVLMCCWYDFIDGNGYDKMDWTVEAFDLTTARSIYRYHSRAGSSGILYRMEKSDEEPGYDYRLFMADGVVYKNSADPTKELKRPLPAGVTPVIQNEYSRHGLFDLVGDQLTWIAGDGIWLAAKDGSGKKLILSNAELPTFLPEGLSGYKHCWGEPRFMCGGTRVAVGVYDNMYEQCHGLLLYDVKTGTIHDLLEGQASARVQYPYADRYAVSRLSRSSILFDTQTGDSRDDIEFMGTSSGASYSTYDYETLIVVRYEGDTRSCNRLAAYVCDVDSINDESHLLLSAEDETIAYLSGVTENLAVFSGKDIDGRWISAAKYR